MRRMSWKGNKGALSCPQVLSNVTPLLKSNAFSKRKRKINAYNTGKEREQRSNITYVPIIPKLHQLRPNCRAVSSCASLRRRISSGVPFSMIWIWPLSNPCRRTSQVALSKETGIVQPLKAVLRLVLPCWIVLVRAVRAPNCCRVVALTSK